MLKFLTISLFSILVAIVIYFYMLGRASKNQPAKLLTGQTLAQCPDKPNCVCSEHEQDIEHYIAPLEISNILDFENINLFKQTIVQMGGKIATEQGAYLSATFKSGIFGFVDDFEIRIDKQNQQIQVRSASRVGKSDFGSNKKRVEKFKQTLSDKLSDG